MHRPTARYAACADIGGTKVLLGLVSPDGLITARDRYLLDAPIRADREPQRLVQQIIQGLQRLATDAGLPWKECAGIGCSAAVMGDIERGIILTAPPMLGQHRNVPFRDMLEAASGRPALIEMDAYAAALGEAWKGIGAGVDYFVYVVVGTGVGSGILMRGQVFRGWHGTAGEFGHMTIDPNGPPCNCGRFGCLEAFVAGPAIALRAKAALLQGRKTAMAVPVGGEIAAEDVFEAARQGDPVAMEIVETTASYLGLGLSNLVHLLNPQVVALGGGVLRGGADLLLEPVRRATLARCGPWVRTDMLRIELAGLGEDAALLGVARLVWQMEGKHR